MIIKKGKNIQIWHSPKRHSLEHVNGSKFYFLNTINGTVRYNKNGPSILEGKLLVWKKFDKNHRIDGPAFIRFDYKEFWINGHKYIEEYYWNC